MSIPAPTAPNASRIIEPPAVLTSAPLTLTLFGPLLVLVHGKPIPHLRSRKAQWLLALLTLRHGRPVERDWLAGVLWPEVDQTRASSNLRPTLSDLRAALGSEGCRVQSPNRHALMLDLAGADVDIVAFDAAIASKTLGGYERAVAVYRGTLLEGCYEEWVVQDREGRAHDCLRALQELAAGAAAGGNQDASIDYNRRAVSLDPLLESARRDLMGSLSRKGDSNGALEVYRTFVRLLRRDDPKAAPDAETTALYEKILKSVRNRAIGTLPARVAATEVTETAPTVEGHLPHALTELIGREDERLEVAALLRRSRLVTLFGVGGIGKTRLAVGVAAEIVFEFSDGVRLIALDSLADGALVVGQIAAALRVKQAAGESLLESVIEFLRAKHLLLVLDNCEHLLQASAETAGHLLRECSGLRILATSREALGITGETVWAVPTLSAPEPDHLPEGKAALRQVLLGYDSVKLFVERAHALQKTFELTDQNALWVARLCTKLEGIPLAIELAAGRVRALTVEQIVKNLESRLTQPAALGHLRLLTGGSRTAQQRQQTLRGAIDWSYDLLSERERVLFSRLSVFAGGWELEAAEVICSGNGIEREDVLDLLSSLADKSLVVFDQGKAGARFRLLDMVRQYGAEKLSDSQTMGEIRDRHRDCYLALAELAQPQEGPNQQYWLDRLDREHDNLRAVLDWCASEKAEPEQNDAQASLRIAAAMTDFWDIRGQSMEGRRHLERALALDIRHDATVYRARALDKLSRLCSTQSDFGLAKEYCDESLGICQQIGDQAGIAAALNRLGNIEYMQGHYASAKPFYEKSLELRRQLNDLHGIALTLNNLANIASTFQYEYPMAAMPLFEESLLIRRALGDTRGIAYALSGMGLLATQCGDFERGRALLEESLSLRRELGDEPGIAESIGRLGTNAFYRQEFGLAAELYEEAVRLQRALGNRRSVGWILGNQANALRMLHDYPRASERYQESLALNREIGFRSGVAYALLGLGLVDIAANHTDRATSALRESLRMFLELEHKPWILDSLRGLAALYLHKSEAEKAVRLFSSTEALRHSLSAGVPFPDHDQIEEQIALARLRLGTESFDAEWAAGRALDWEQAAAYALSD